MADSAFKSVDEYIASQPVATQEKLERLRSAIHEAVQGGEDAISYGIPAYKVNGKAIIWYAGWSRHYSVYPANDQVMAAFEGELAPYKVNKGTIRFSLSEPIPAKLIEQLVKFRADEVAEQEKAKLVAKRAKSKT